MDQVIFIPLQIAELTAIISNTVRNEVANFTHSHTEPAPAANEVDLINRKQAAKYLGISLPTLQKWTKDGTLTGYRINSRIRYKRAEIEQSLITLFAHKQSRA